MSNNYSLAGEGALWVQPDGPNTEPQYLGCHKLGDLTEPMGDVNLIYCPDPAIPNKFKVVGSFQQAAGPVTTSIETDVLKTADYMERIKCPASIFINKVTCGRKNTFNSYDRSFVLERAWVTQRGLSNMVAKSPDDQDRSVQTFEISAESIMRIYRLAINRVSVAETEGLNAVASSDTDQCAGDCADSAKAGDTLYAVGDTLAGSAGNTADLLVTADAGTTWAFGSSDPFAASVAIGSVVSIQVDSNTTRIIVARGTTEANAVPIKYSDDGGLTWIAVTVGTVNGQFAYGPAALFALDYYNIWFVTDDGYIYYSSDGGGSWVAQQAGTATAQDLYAVHFANSNDGFAVGAGNVILRTVDGGVTWSLLTGPAAQAGIIVNCVQTHTKYRAWIGYNNGQLYFTRDGGATWSLRNHSLSAAGSIAAMSWYDEYIGYVLHNSAAPVGTVMYTIDGGFTWETVSTPVNAGLNDILAISPTLAWVVGEPQGGTAVVLKVSGL